MSDRRFSINAMIAGAAMLAASASSAATLDGASFQVDYLFPDVSTVYPFSDGPIFGTVGPGNDAIIIVEGVTAISLDFGASSLEVILNTVLNLPTWNVVPFNGLRITFTDLATAITGFDLTDTDLSPAASVTPTFTATELFISWPGVSYVDGSTANFSIDLAPEPIPLPAALPLLLTGLGAVGAFALRRARKAAA